MDKYKELQKKIENADYVEFADFGDGISEDWIKKAEDRLGFELPTSYKWWLRNYSGGEIYGEEIYSIYEQDFDTVVGGDIVYMHELNSKNGTFNGNVLVVCEANDEVYYFDLTKKTKDGEYPVYCWNSKSKYAEDFIEFLNKMISEE